MAALPQYSYIFGLGLCFAFLDAWNIGANDVANSFATSVSSRSLTMIQAMTIGAVMEFLGAVLAGNRVAGTIRNDIIQISEFEETPSVLMLGMLCALIGSSLFLTLATKIGLPVSTTHCIIGGIIGVGFATVGANGVDWSWEGVSQVFAAWGIAPCVAGAFGALLFLFTKYGVMKSRNPLIVGMWTIPVFFGLTSGILTMLVVWKGAASLDLDDWGVAPTVGTIFGVAGGVALLSALFLMPFIYVRLVKEDWKLKQWEIIKGPLLLRRPDAGPIPEGMRLVPDYYAGHKTRSELDSEGRMIVNDRSSDEESLDKTQVDVDGISTEKRRESYVHNPAVAMAEKPADPAVPEVKPKWWEPAQLWKTAKWTFFRGVMIDIVSEQSATTRNNEPKFLQRLLVGKNLADKHARVEHYDNKVEHLYSFLQVMTAATASFGHGANDVANAMGPLAAIYQIWQTNTAGEDSEVPIWVLIFGGAAISIGLWTYGYNLMRNLGNRITLHSPARGFCMELGAAVTVVLATRLALPVSTTQCIIGATVGVGLCAGDFRAINWRMVLWSYAGWFITLPSTAVISGCLMGFVINAPQWGRTPAAIV
ncbi:hypothetical protein CKM354_000707900 [Cercospora kikuchii]|uniref:Phosphate transporter n=1 Tax=Cercospora kikuchii TaxID=84275 RepID=A0A9P3CKJ0_9PEZI|nr:uncharacterized protein CKM354_000707900 [Cercospora kikuchii]GIZ43866.1 hypothetical protein CKM354_000707900 [Cercospora kikuchii]